MRLTIFHNIEPEPLWKSSLAKLLQPQTLADLKKLGDVHIAVFNDGVVGISVSHKQQIVYLKVRDITRRRGVGKYLLEETIAFMSEDCDEAILDINDFPLAEHDGLIYFLEMQGFIKDAHSQNLYKYTIEKVD